MIILAILVKCTSRGQAIYGSDRVSKGGKVFKFFNFRMMNVSTEVELEEF